MASSIMIVAGEASADLHGAGLVSALKRLRPDCSVWGVGGASMRAAGFEAVVDAERISIGGLTEVLFALPRIWGILRKLKRLVADRRPHVVVLIDLPDFNLRLAKKVKYLGIPVVYYISPQVWAWRQRRVKQIKNLVTQMLCILPFEQTFYQQHGIRAQFVGHPLVEELPESPDRDEAKAQLGISAEQGPVIAVLPGSREKEVSRHLPVMLEGVRRLKLRYPDLVPIVPVASTISEQLVNRIIERVGIRTVTVPDQATTVLAASDIAAVCSGTSTLQAALLSRPMVVVYRVSWLSFQILKRLVSVAHIALVNLIAGRRLVPELLQSDLTPQRLEEELRRILDDPLTRIRMGQEFAAIRKQLGRGSTARQVAQVVVNYLPEIKRPTSPPVAGTMAPVRVRVGSERDDG